MWRRLWIARGGKATAVGAAAHGGVLRRVRGRAMERDRGKGEGRERVREFQGGAWRRPGVEAAAEAGGGQARGRTWRAHAPRPSGERRETTGIGQLGWAGSWAAQVSGPGTNSLSLLFNLFCFSIYFVLF